MLLYVYGTLRKGRSNHELIKHLPFLGEAVTDNNYTLVVSGLPFLVKRKGEGVKGELYKIDPDTLRAVDRLEGVPNFYYREPIWVTDMNTGETVEAYTYLHPDVFNKKDYPWDYVVKREF